MNSCSLEKNYRIVGCIKSKYKRGNCPIWKHGIEEVHAPYQNFSEIADWPANSTFSGSVFVKNKPETTLDTEIPQDPGKSKSCHSQHALSLHFLKGEDTSLELSFSKVLMLELCLI